MVSLNVEAINGLSFGIIQGYAVLEIIHQYGFSILLDNNCSLYISPFHYVQILYICYFYTFQRTPLATECFLCCWFRLSSFQLSHFRKGNYLLLCYAKVLASCYH